MKQTKRKLSAILSAVMLCALCVAPAHALEYSIDGADDYLFGRPTSDDTIMCSDAAFGNLPWRRVDSPNWDQIRAGDLVEYGNAQGRHVGWWL